MVNHYKELTGIVLFSGYTDFAAVPTVQVSLCLLSDTGQELVRKSSRINKVRLVG